MPSPSSRSEENVLSLNRSEEDISWCKLRDNTFELEDNTPRSENSSLVETKNNTSKPEEAIFDYRDDRVELKNNALGSEKDAFKSKKNDSESEKNTFGSNKDVFGFDKDVFGSDKKVSESDEDASKSDKDAFRSETILIN